MEMENMPQPAILEAIARAAEELDMGQQARVLAYIQSVKARPQGTAPDRLLKFAGAISLEDCAQMQRIIDEGCGQVNSAAW